MSIVQCCVIVLFCLFLAKKVLRSAVARILLYNTTVQECRVNKRERKIKGVCLGSTCPPTSVSFRSPTPTTPLRLVAPFASRLRLRRERRGKPIESSLVLSRYVRWLLPLQARRASGGAVGAWVAAAAAAAAQIRRRMPRPSVRRLEQEPSRPVSDRRGRRTRPDHYHHACADPKKACCASTTILCKCTGLTRRLPKSTVQSWSWMMV
ncbi:hypothetical protein BS78_06G003600 [Paspalum vaginatum]|nr:hypothetical protein BS78_06G003600 [Paspalum vaginatum]